MVGITGTNGKSTVTTLVGAFAEAAGLEVRVGGNLGEPALDLLEGPPAAMYVLELSSYQLETTLSLQLEAAAVLNVTPDHLDRYRDLAEYAAAKARIFERAATAVVNLDDEIVVRMPRPGQRSVGFSLRRSDADFRLLRARRRGLAGRGRRADPAARGARAAGPPQRRECARRARGRQRAAASRARRWPACCAASAACRIARSACATGAASRWIDDSKGTNVGATVAAIEGLDGPLVLIAGGEGKGQDFTPLGPACQGKVRQAVLIGRDARAARRRAREVAARFPSRTRWKRRSAPPPRSRARATPCCCRRPARASTCSATTRSAARLSPLPCGSCRHEHRRRAAVSRARPAASSGSRSTR